MPLFAARDFFRSRFPRAARPRLDGLAAGDEGGRAFEDVENVSVMLMDFYFARSRAASGLDLEIVCGQQRSALGKGDGNRFMIEMNHRAGLRLVGSERCQQETCGQE